MEQNQIDQYYDVLKKSTALLGQFLNPDVDFTKELVAGLITNSERYGYQSCPCRKAVGEYEKDKDIVCPCAYRDADVAEFGNCYCALYVSKEVSDGIKKAHRIPERRPKQ